MSYADSAKQGTAAVAKAVNDFHMKCPKTKIVLVGYSQGGQIMDNAFCGGGDTAEGIASTAIPIDAAALKKVKAVIMMGNPRYVAGLPYELGTCKAQGVRLLCTPIAIIGLANLSQFDARPSTFTCPGGNKIQSYCDAADPYCCNGNDAATHQGYGTEYGQDALTFIKSKLGAASGSKSSSGSTTKTKTTAAPTSVQTGGSSAGTVTKL